MKTTPAPAAAPAAPKELSLSPKQTEYIRGKYAQVQALFEEINAVSRFALFEHGTPPGNWQLSECRTKLVLAPSPEGGK